MGSPESPMALDDLPTPCLLLDFDVVERNLRQMARRASALGVALQRLPGWQPRGDRGLQLRRTTIPVLKGERA